MGPLWGSSEEKQYQLAVGSVFGTDWEEKKVSREFQCECFPSRETGGERDRGGD